MEKKEKAYSITLVSTAMILFLILVSSTISAASGQGTMPMKTYAYITNYADGTVSIIDTDTDTVTDTVKIEAMKDAGSKPLGIAFTPDGSKLYVANALEAGVYANSVSVIDTETKSVIAAVNVGNYPFGVAVTPDGNEAYIANWGDTTISVIDTDTNEVTASIDTGKSPTGIAFTPDGKKAYVTNSGEGTVSVIDTTTKKIMAKVQQIDYTCWGVAVNPVGTKAYVTNQLSTNISVINTNKNLVTATVKAGNSPYGVAFTPDGSKAYVTNTGDGTISVINTTTDIVISTVNVGSSPMGVAVSPDGKKVYVANGDSDTVSVIDTTTNKVTATVNVGVGPVAFGQFIGFIPAKPVILADFLASTTKGKVPLKVQFTDKSTGSPTSWEWNFGDGTSSTTKNPTHTYSKAGKYTVSLTVENTVGSNTTTKFSYINVVNVAKPVAAFSAVPTSGKTPLKVTFTDKSTGSPASWNWNFGDGESSTEKNPEHQYLQEGNYKVTLAVTNAAGSSMTTKTNYIKVTTNTRPGIYSESR